MTAPEQPYPAFSVSSGLRLPPPPFRIDMEEARIDPRRLMFVRHLIESGRMGEEGD